MTNNKIIKKSKWKRGDKAFVKGPLKNPVMDVNVLTGETFNRSILENAQVYDKQRSQRLAKSLSEQKQIIERKLWLLEWAMSGDIEPEVFLKTEKGLSQGEATTFMLNCPKTYWYRMLEHVQEKAVSTMVKRHVDSVATLNDQHLMASKLAMAKALEFLSKIKIEQVDGKFVGFKTTDLKNCIESIHTAQKISRVALGLPSDEGSVHVWQKIQNSINIHPPSLEDVPDTSSEVKRQALLIQKSYTYDEIKDLIKAVRLIRPPTDDVIDVGGDNDSEEGLRHGRH